MKKMSLTKDEFDIEINTCPECGGRDISQIESHELNCSIRVDMEWEAQQHLIEDANEAHYQNYLKEGSQDEVSN